MEFRAEIVFDKARQRKEHVLNEHSDHHCHCNFKALTYGTLKNDRIELGPCITFIPGMSPFSSQITLLILSADRLYAGPALFDSLNNHSSSIGDIRRSKISGL